MEEFHILSCGVFRYAQRMRQKCGNWWLSLAVSGWKSLRMTFPNGELPEAFAPEHPVLFLSGPGCELDFEFTAERENYVIVLDAPPLDFSEDGRGLVLKNGGGAIPLVGKVALSEPELPAVRTQFEAILRNHRGVLPADRVRAELLLAGLLARFLPENPVRQSPGIELKNAMDADRERRCSIAELCRKLHGNPDVMRRDFMRCFDGLSPAGYRDLMRKNDILSLFSCSDESFKEIASRLGLPNVQYLNYLVRKYFDCTPGELQTECRRMQDRL